MSGKIISISISEARGELKHSVEHAEINQEGIVGDGHSGNWDRQVTLLNHQSFLKTQQDYPQHHFQAGSFAENIQVDGIDFTQIKVKTRIRLGRDVVLEVSQIGKEDHPSVVTRAYGVSLLPYEGLFCKVLTPGHIHVNDRVEILPASF